MRVATARTTGHGSTGSTWSSCHETSRCCAWTRAEDRRGLKPGWRLVRWRVSRVGARAESLAPRVELGAGAGGQRAVDEGRHVERLTVVQVPQLGEGILEDLDVGRLHDAVAWELREEGPR